MVAIPLVRYRLGAEELVELGRGAASPVPGREPFLANRGRRALGSAGMGDLVDVAEAAGEFISRNLAFTLGLLDDLSPRPVDELVLGEGVARKAMADLLDHVPSLGDLLAQVLLLGNAVLVFGLAIPGRALRGLENLLRGIEAVLAEKGLDQAKMMDDAKAEILAKASPGFSEKIKAVLDAAGVRGSDLASAEMPRQSAPAAPPLAGVETGSSGLAKVLSVGVPALGAAAIVMLAGAVR